MNDERPLSVVRNRPSLQPGEEWAAGQRRIAQRFAQIHAGDYKYVDRLGWLAWDGTRWAEDNLSRRYKALADMLRESHILAYDTNDKQLAKDVNVCNTSSATDGVFKFLSDDHRFRVLPEHLDSDPYLLNVLNGTLDLRTMTVKPHDPADLITKITRASYRTLDELTEDDLWLAFLAQILPDEEKRDLLQRYAGLALYGAVLEHSMPILTGLGRNGKGVFYNALAYALGDFAAIPEPDLLMAKEHAPHSTGLLDLRGARAAFVSETHQGRRLDAALVKRLTGGDPITGRRMFRDNITFTPSHQLFFISNYLPVVDGSDTALMARLPIFTFDVSFDPAVPGSLPADVHLPEKLRGQIHLDTILRWAVDGWRKYQADGLTRPAAVQAASDAYRADSDPIGQFLTECCRTNFPHDRAEFGQLKQAYAEWCTESGQSPITDTAFGTALTRRNHPLARSHGRSYRVGIALLTRGNP